ncbi:restriction endonuclease subunit S [Myxococcus sp. K15C18031901]|uniref:restriction endonuclease subunit S n=1 Tax=Myxococcus dinghuensis TaxID=2906761 RepID=UPI0020A8068E|nr:restriction endonuclease subunit S [Myxococcus dinghuensis]MCP3105476.1 restriction endonuclease subunit S [Myxococcus dinghuensis]
MKPSGLGWAGDIPSDWDVAKICLVAKLESGHTPSRQHPEYWVPSECTIPWFSLADVWQLREGTQDYLGETSECISPMGIAHSAARLLPAGTVALSRTASVGFAGIMPRPMATTQDFANWVPGERVVSEYLLYALRAMRDEFSRVMTGSTHQTIYMPDIRRLAIPVPPRDEQTRIVAHLRARLPKLDALIAKKEQVLALLAEKRQALITQAVTKGLGPNAPMKESGNEALPSIPRNWQIVPLRYLLSFGPRNGVSPPTAAGEGVLSFSISAVRDGKVTIEGNEKYVDFDRASARAYWLARGDILLMRGNGSLSLVGTCGLVETVPEECTYPDILMRMRAGRRLMPEFLVAAINSPYVRGQVETLAKTSNGTFKISGEDVRTLQIAVPPIDEQRQIVTRMHVELRRLDGVAVRVGDQLDRLREYRQALITAAVTGKLDIASVALTASVISHHAEAELA